MAQIKTDSIVSIYLTVEDINLDNLIVFTLKRANRADCSHYNHYSTIDRVKSVTALNEVKTKIANDINDLIEWLLNELYVKRHYNSADVTTQKRLDSIAIFSDKSLLSDKQINRYDLTISQVNNNIINTLRELCKERLDNDNSDTKFYFAKDKSLPSIHLSQSELLSLGILLVKCDR